MLEEHRYPAEYERALKASLLGVALGALLTILARRRSA
jgi:hypothetical protein